MLTSLAHRIIDKAAEGSANVRQAAEGNEDSLAKAREQPDGLVKDQPVTYSWALPADHGAEIIEAVLTNGGNTFETKNINIHLAAAVTLMEADLIKTDSLGPPAVSAILVAFAINISPRGVGSCGDRLYSLAHWLTNVTFGN